MSRRFFARHPLLRILLTLAICCALLLAGSLLLTLHGSAPGAVEAAPPPPPTRSALFVVGSTTLSAGDTAIKARLEQLGLTVSVKDAVSAVTADANGKGLVVISESVPSADANSKFRDVAVPVVVMEPNIYDDMMMTGPTSFTDYGYLSSQPQVHIDNATHQMAANFTGTVGVASSVVSFGWGVPGPGAIKVASMTDVPTRYALFGYETGAAMVGMNAPARRAGVFLVHLMVPYMNSNAWALFDAAVRWTANLSPFSLNSSVLFVVGSTTLSAGDAATKTRLESLGLTVSMKDAVSAVTADANGKGLVVVSESSPSADINAKFRDVAVPVVVLEPQVFDDMLMTGPTLNVDFGYLTDQLQVQIDNPIHQMAANLTGTVTLAGSPSGYAWGIPGANAIKVASLSSAPSRSLLFGYETGATMVGMNAPARRAGVFLVHASATAVNSDGWALFDAAIRWCGNWGVNVALAANGGVASSSSSFSLGYLPSGANNGDCKGLNWGSNGGWNDALPGAFPDWLQIDFQGKKTIGEIDVFTVQDAYSNPSDPSETMTFSTYGATDYDVQYWDDSAWVTVPGGRVFANTRVWRRFAFSNIRTSKIRVVVQDSADHGYSRLVEVEAWQSQANQTPLANPGGPYSGMSGSPVPFNGSGSSDADGTIGNYQWSFGDGTVATGPTPTHVYSSTGTFNVTLTVTDNSGAPASANTTASVTIPNQPPVANAGGPYSVSANTPIQFNGTTSSDPDGTITSYQWNFGDGSTGNGVTTTHTYLVPSSYTVTLTVTDNLGATAANSVNVNVRDPRISRLQIFPGNVTLRPGAHEMFAAVAFDSTNVQIGGINYSWHTNYSGQDGRVSISQTGEFQSEVEGVYAVTAEGGGHLAQVTVTVLAPPAPCTGTCLESVPDSDPFGWKPANYFSAHDPRNLRGNPAGQSTEGNGNYQLSIPLLSLPGRGVDLDLVLRYNSRLWTKSGTQMTFDIDKDWPAPGWSLNFGKMINMVDSGVFIVDQDGTRHSFSGTIDRKIWEYTFVGETTDGSFIKYRCVTPRDPYTGTFSGPRALVKYPNGVTVYFYGFAANPANGTFIMVPTQIIDSNGNFISINYQNVYQSQRIQTIVDTLGRAIVFHYDNQDLLTAITAAGLLDQNGNQTSRILARFNYRSYYLDDSLFSGVTQQVYSRTISVIKAIYLPATGDGYWFGDSDSYSSYGMIRRVSVHRGMSFSTVSNDPVQSLKEQGTIVAGSMTHQQVYSYPQTAQALSSSPTYDSMVDSWDSMDTPPATTLYSVNNFSTPRTITITRPDGTQLVRLSYNYSQLADSDPTKLMDGRVYQEELKDANGTVLRRSFTNWETGFRNSPRITRSEVTEIDYGQSLMTAVVYGYDGGEYNQVIRLSEYGFGGAVVRITNTAYAIKNDFDLGLVYVNGAPRYDLSKDISPRFLYLPTSVEVRSSDNTIAGYVEFAYDQTQLQNVDGLQNIAYPFTCGPQGCAGIAHHEGCFNPYLRHCVQDGTNGGQISVRGNVTSTTRYADAAGRTGPQSDQLTYDIAGNVINTTSSGGLSQRVTYTKDAQNAYPIFLTVGSSSDMTAQVTTGMAYDFNTGLVLSTKNANGRETVNTYFSDSWRPKEIIFPTGARTNFEYDDPARKITKTTRSTLNGAIASQSIRSLNGLGEVHRERALAVQGLNGSNDIWDNVDSLYDQFGRLSQRSKPYQDGQAPQFRSTGYDARGRVVSMTDANGYGPRYLYNETSRPSGASSDVGQTIKSSDAWGRWRWTRFDSSGQPVEVVEPNPSGGIGFQTNYFYDMLANLIRIEQGNQVRRFRYDSLGRLTHQKLSEAAATLNNIGEKATGESENERWSDVFTYDQRSNMISRTDARGVRTIFSYKDSSNNDDPLNRLQSISYNTSRVNASLTVLPAATINYQYKSKSPSEWVDIHQVKRVRAVGVSTEDYDYDIEGRVHEKKLTLDSRTKSMTITYDYDALSRVSQITYPEQYHDDVPNPVRKVVKPNYDVASRVEGVKVNEVNYASQAVYNAASQITSLGVGTGVNQVVENFNYDVLTGWLVNQNVKRGTTILVNLSYGYKAQYCSGSNCPSVISPYTGQVTRMSDDSGTNSYSYDTLGRLNKVEGGTVGKNQSFSAQWSENYSYDRFGNRLSVTSLGNAGGLPVPSDGWGTLAYDSTTNRITTPGFSYDDAGNQLQNGTGKSFVYDAAGRLAQVKDQTNTVVATYTFGSSNRRLIAQTGPENSTARTYYIWNDEDVLAEYVEPSASSVMPKWSKNYIYFNGDLLATEEPNGTGELVSYHHADRLGTRLVTNSTDTTSFQQVTLPFGTELPAQSTGSTNRRFTSYDRSQSSELDYAVNRNYDSHQGRFTQVDPIGIGSVQLQNPQSFNLYAYCGNDPFNAIDPTGTSGFTFSFGGFPSGGGDGRGGSGGFWGGLFNFGTGLLGSIFGGQTGHVIGSPFLTLPPPTRVVPVPTPATIASSGVFTNLQTGQSEETTENFKPWVISRVLTLRQLILDNDKAGTPWDGYRHYGDNIRFCATLPMMWDFKHENKNIGPRRVDSWRMGPALVWNMSVAKGTVVATFNRALGEYNNYDSGNHTAIFLSWYQDADGTRGMWVIEQGPNWLPRGNKIPFNDANPYFQNANVFNMVLINQPKPQPPPRRRR
jgi:RHS repeat-associated protein